LLVFGTSLLARAIDVGHRYLLLLLLLLLLLHRHLRRRSRLRLVVRAAGGHDVIVGSLSAMDAQFGVHRQQISHSPLVLEAAPSG